MTSLGEPCPWETNEARNGVKQARLACWKCERADCLACLTSSSSHRSWCAGFGAIERAIILLHCVGAPSDGGAAAWKSDQSTRSAEKSPLFSSSASTPRRLLISCDMPFRHAEVSTRHCERFRTSLRSRPKG